jgi:hypothetical protein
MGRLGNQPKGEVVVSAHPGFTVEVRVLPLPPRPPFGRSCNAELDEDGRTLPFNSLRLHQVRQNRGRGFADLWPLPTRCNATTTLVAPAPLTGADLDLTGSRSRLGGDRDQVTGKTVNALPFSAAAAS